jgi:hypothetical protein
MDRNQINVLLIYTKDDEPNLNVGIIPWSEWIARETSQSVAAPGGGA